MRRGDGRRDGGSALVEFIVVGVGILVPVAYLGLAAVSVQAAAFATTQAVREAARAFSTSTTAAEGRLRALAAARLAFADHALTLPPGAMRITCPDGPCLGPGTSVVVDVAWSVRLPWLPSSLADGATPAVRIQASQRVPIDDYRGDAA
jgi:hypothetical protein